MKTEDILIIAAVAAGAYFLFIKPNQYPYQRYPDIPVAPPQGTDEFDVWVQRIKEIYGFGQELFGPGGPFYNKKIQ